MTYLKGFWNESRGDQFDNWGTSCWYFECDEKMWVSRQMEIYANGTVLHYDDSHLEDGFGGLSEKPLDQEYEKELSPISKTEFEELWNSKKPTNR